MPLEQLPIDLRVVAPAAAWSSRVAQLDRPLADDIPFATYVAGATVAAALDGRPVSDDGATTTARWLTSDESWPGVLELDREGSHRAVLVVAAQSSMEPRPVWPVDIPVADFETWDFDAVVAAYVPKRMALEAPDTGARPVVHACGWLPAERVRGLQRVSVVAHPGHDFQATYLQARVCDMWALDRILSELPEPS